VGHSLHALHKLDAEIDDRDAHDLIVRACDVGVMSNRLIPSVLHEWREPRLVNSRKGMSGRYSMHLLNP